MAVAGSAIDSTPKSVEAAPASAVAGGDPREEGRKGGQEDGRQPGREPERRTGLHHELHEGARRRLEANRSPEQRRTAEDEGSGREADGLGNRVPGLLRDPVELPEGAQRHQRHQHVENDRGRQEERREDEGDRDRGRELALP